MIDLTPIKSDLPNNTIAIMGLGISGLAVVKACLAADIKAIVWDDNEQNRQKAKELGADVKALEINVLAEADLLVLAPGIPLTHPEPHPIVLRTKNTGLEIICDIELFYRAKPNATTIGITGTNGKSTTTALITHILQNAGKNALMGGNIGEAILSLKDMIDDDDNIYVIELSSYQLDLCPSFKPHIAALLNISPDHLDRHGGIEGYVTAKKKIFSATNNKVIAIDDEYTKEVIDIFPKAVKVSNKDILQQGVYVNDTCVLIDDTANENRPVIDLKHLPHLAGRHNWQNIAVAYAVCKTSGLSMAETNEGITSFTGLTHRQNIVANLNHVSYINDSKATNDEAASMALRTFENIYWIAGGQAKEGGFEACNKYLNEIRHAFLIGQDQDQIANWLSSQNIAYTKCTTLDIATKKAHLMAQENKETRNT
ncbi:MAG: UDP-N-acetylmuramoyl-L-alanine--D-glutamate ligase, partial [Gammaproteobacteria bacterium]|nr:UDP-N-acetylmuramoyl-L-alanine--D-glutamate ligase [Gammaproteobacteria bacterium]